MFRGCCLHEDDAVLPVSDIRAQGVCIAPVVASNEEDLLAADILVVVVKHACEGSSGQHVRFPRAQGLHGRGGCGGRTPQLGISIFLAVTNIDKVELGAAIGEVLSKHMHILVLIDDARYAQGLCEAFDVGEDAYENGHIVAEGGIFAEVVDDLLLEQLGRLNGAVDGVPQQVIAELGAVAIDENGNVGVVILIGKNVVSTHEVNGRSESAGHTHDKTFVLFVASHVIGRLLLVHDAGRALGVEIQPQAANLIVVAVDSLQQHLYAVSAGVGRGECAVCVCACARGSGRRRTCTKRFLSMSCSAHF